MARITEKQVQDRFKIIQNYEPRLILEFAYGRQCVSLKSEEGSGTERRLSGYLSRPEIMLWMDGYYEASRVQTTKRE